jgi:D-alanyl-D-alanine carboxypeptidase
MRNSLNSYIALIVFTLALSLAAPVSVAFGQVQHLVDTPGVKTAIAVFDSWVQQRVIDQELPGLSIGIVYDQELIWAKGYGYAELAKKTPATPSTAYRIASLTKLFTATAILQLRDAGKLQLDDPVSKYVPWFRLKDDFGDSPVITLRHLLTHTSGLPRELIGLYWDDMVFPDHDKFVQMFQEASTILPRETEFKYSNVAFSVLGDVVANASGQPYPEYVKAHILTPLGMNGTEVLPTKDMPTLATGYKFRKSGDARIPEPFIDLKGMVSCGNIASTVEDLAKFLSLQFRVGPAGGTQVLKGSTLAEMQRVQWLDTTWQSGHGLGWHMSRVEDRVRITHTGYVNGHTSSISACVPQKFGVIVLANADDAKPWVIAEQIWTIVAPAVKAAVATPDQPIASDTSWEKFTGEYEWVDGSFSRVLVAKGELVIIDPRSDNPWAERDRLEPLTDGTFRLKGGSQKGELVRFEADKSGKIVSMVWPGYSAAKR